MALLTLKSISVRSLPSARSELSLFFEMAALRDALLRQLRVRVGSPFPAPVGTIDSARILRRRFSEGAVGTFLDKSEVAERTITVVKNFQKVDPSKVCSPILILVMLDRITNPSRSMVIEGFSHFEN